MVVLSVRAYCSATPPWYAAAAVRTACLAVDACEQRTLGVDAELVAVAGDRGVEELGVRREDERRELRHCRVEQELRLHRVPVLRVDVGSRRARRGGRAGPSGGGGRGRVVGVAAGEQRGRAAGQTGAEHGASGRDGHLPILRRVVGWRHDREGVDTRL